MNKKLNKIFPLHAKDDPDKRPKETKSPLQTAKPTLWNNICSTLQIRTTYFSQSYIYTIYGDTLLCN